MDFRGDDRAQSIQIGAVIFFGIVMIAFSSYQAFVVPDQNRQVDFNHFLEVQDDMERLRNAVISAGQTGRSVPADVKLGTTYPMRAFAAQPQGSTGTLWTRTIGGATNEITLENTDASITDICGLDSPTTRAATYQPDYAYLDTVGNITYENTVLYTSGATDGRSFQTDQQLVDGDTIHLYPLLGEYNQGGTGVTTLTLRGGITGTNGSVPGGFDLVLPTQLSADKWTDILAEQPQVTGVTDVIGRQAVRISFATGETYEIRCSPAGVGKTPNNDPNTGGVDSINPNFGSDVVLEDVTAGTGGTLPENAVVLQLRNTDRQEYQNMTQLRFPFYSANAQSSSGDSVPDSLSVDGTLVERIGKLKSVDVTFAPGETRDIQLEFWCTADGTEVYNVENGDFFVLTAFFGADKDRTYFAALEDAGSTGGSRCGSGSFDDGSGSGGGGSDTPTITSYSASGTNSQRIDVTASVEDAGNNLDRAEFEVTDSGGTVVETRTVSLSGGSTSIDITLTNSNTNNGKFPNGSYDVEMTVFDSAGDSASESRSVTV